MWLSFHILLTVVMIRATNQSWWEKLSNTVSNYFFPPGTTYLETNAIDTDISNWLEIDTTPNAIAFNITIVWQGTVGESEGAQNVVDHTVGNSSKRKECDILTSLLVQRNPLYADAMIVCIKRNDVNQSSHVTAVSIYFNITRFPLEKEQPGNCLIKIAEELKSILSVSANDVTVIAMPDALRIAIYEIMFSIEIPDVVNKTIESRITEIENDFITNWIAVIENGTKLIGWHFNELMGESIDWLAKFTLYLDEQDCLIQNNANHSFNCKITLQDRNEKWPVFNDQLYLSSLNEFKKIEIYSSFSNNVKYVTNKCSHWTLENRPCFKIDGSVVEFDDEMVLDESISRKEYNEKISENINELITDNFSKSNNILGSSFGSHYVQDGKINAIYYLYHNHTDENTQKNIRDLFESSWHGYSKTAKLTANTANCLISNKPFQQFMFYIKRTLNLNHFQNKRQNRSLNHRLIKTLVLNSLESTMHRWKPIGVVILRVEKILITVNQSANVYCTAIVDTIKVIQDIALKMGSLSLENIRDEVKNLYAEYANGTAIDFKTEEVSEVEESILCGDRIFLAENPPRLVIPKKRNLPKDITESALVQTNIVNQRNNLCTSSRFTSIIYMLFTMSCLGLFNYLDI